MGVDREKIKRKAIDAIDKADEEELRRGKQDKEYAHDWLQAVIGFISGLMGILGGIFSGCHITEAVSRKSRPPRARRTLNRLRRYRDEFILAGDDPSRRAELEAYYSLAPRLIQWINRRPERDRIWAHLYGVIRRCVDFIEEDQKEKAYQLYKDEILGIRSSTHLQRLDTEGLRSGSIPSS